MHSLEREGPRKGFGMGFLQTIKCDLKGGKAVGKMGRRKKIKQPEPRGAAPVTASEQALMINHHDREVVWAKRVHKWEPRRTLDRVLLMKRGRVIVMTRWLEDSDSPPSSRT